MREPKRPYLRCRARVVKPRAQSDIAPTDAGRSTAALFFRPPLSFIAAVRSSLRNYRSSKRDIRAEEFFEQLSRHHRDIILAAFLNEDINRREVTLDQISPSGTSEGERAISRFTESGFTHVSLALSLSLNICLSYLNSSV